MTHLAKEEKLLAELEIKTLLVRERYYRDTAQWAKLRACYHPDASKTKIKITWFHGDIDGFVSGSEKMVRGGATSTHTICPVEVYISGGRAVTESTGSISTRIRHAGAEYDCTSYTRFVTRLERVGAAGAGDWKMLTLEAIYDKDMLLPVLPGIPGPSHQAAEVPVLDEGARRSYRCLSWVLTQRGFSIDQTLPGMDVPGSAGELMETYLRWLQGGDA